MFGSINFSRKGKHGKEGEREGIGVSFRPENFIPGLVIGFIFGLVLDLTKPLKPKTPPKSYVLGTNNQSRPSPTYGNPDEDLKMVLVVRQDLKMGPGKIASQCAHAAMGMYAELMQSQRSLLRQWEQCGQAKIVVTCKNLKEMTKLEQEAETIGLPTFVVADAGRTQVAAGSKTVLAIGPGRKTFVDSVTGKQRLL
ncbi:uncharacterized protein LOC141600205 [Silene latifolia]|uniref:uncharacterized protein LOC141600205 n=1 Tax=Silene latifolia TaxID=37657 RepID=UPI003D78A9F3